jgi:hypothetical protein
MRALLLALIFGILLLYFIVVEAVKHFFHEISF